MKKSKTNEGIFVFGCAYIVSFTLLYSILFHGLSGFIFFLLIIMTLNILSFISVLAFIFFNRVKKKKPNNLVYILISFLFFLVSFYIFSNSESDPKNIFPIFKEPFWIFVLLSFATHFIAFFTYKLFNYIKH